MARWTAERDMRAAAAMCRVLADAVMAPSRRATAAPRSRVRHCGRAHRSSPDMAGHAAYFTKAVSQGAAAQAASLEETSSLDDVIAGCIHRFAHYLAAD